MDQETKSKALATVEAGAPADRPAPVLLPTAEPFGRPIVVPALVADVGPRAAKRFANFFGSNDNDNTRAAYQRACHCFFAWCDAQGLDELAAIEPIHVGAYIKSMAGKFEKPTIKQHLAAIRMLFDYLVVGQILAINPAHAVRGPKHSIKRGKTPVLSAAQARELLDSIDVSTVVGLRDRALIALMTFSFARVGAAVGMRVEDYFADGKRWRLRLNEKGSHPPPQAHRRRPRRLTALSDRRRQCEGVAAQHVHMPVGERREASDVFVADIEPFCPQLGKGRIHINGVP